VISVSAVSVVVAIMDASLTVKEAPKSLGNWAKISGNASCKSSSRTSPILVIFWNALNLLMRNSNGGLRAGSEFKVQNSA
jgi:hypothetical protein